MLPKIRLVDCVEGHKVGWRPVDRTLNGSNDLRYRDWYPRCGPRRRKTISTTAVVLTHVVDEVCLMSFGHAVSLVYFVDNGWSFAAMIVVLALAFCKKFSKD